MQGVGEKASLNLGKRYWKMVLKGKSCTCINTKSIIGHALVAWSRVQNSFLLLMYFFNLLLFFFSLFFLFFSLPFLLIHFRVIYYGFYTNFSTHVWVKCSEFLCPLSPLLEPSTLSCKAAGLLFRHHLHINVARELAGQHLHNMYSLFAQNWVRLKSHPIFMQSHPMTLSQTHRTQKAPGYPIELKPHIIILPRYSLLLL